MASITPNTDIRTQYALQLLQVFFVGLTLGMTRTVIPAVADSDFGVPRGDVALIAAFIIAFGVVKAAMNFVAGALSERLGRRRVLLVGWLLALPIPWLIWSAPNWWWIVAAMVLLGMNQGLTWSMTLTSKLDLTRPEHRGLTNGLNEFAGYSAVAVAGVVTARLSEQFGARIGLLMFGALVIVPALSVAALFVQETRPQVARADIDVSNDLSRHRRTFIALNQGGLFEKFIDCAMWLLVPVYLTLQGVPLRDIGWAPGAYAATWGCAQVITGPLSDRIGRKPLITGGMLMCAVAIALFPIRSGMTWWTSCATAAGLGMAMLYPTLGAAVSDLAPIESRGRMLGAYRFWRDLGYALGAVFLAIISAMRVPAVWSFALVGCVVAVSAIVLGLVAGETRPRMIKR